ncbi:hypothetical protein AcW1_007403 [Taiwanofungus camphoratus]|nr:hypothetical protein AcW2_007535 [Antrodia cinnamomea]KAI0947077.1 hypothetical protein AcV7_009605 [Antrodia cinnamomea]KAI0953085.1 hypothetical protein AcW1_007403 [Antrodia cinnamomea]
MHERPRRRRHAQILHERNPALITLPFSLPSVPILSPLLDPLLSPLIAGEPQPTTGSTEAPETSTQAQQSSTQADETPSPSPTTAPQSPTQAPSPAPSTTAQTPSNPGPTGSNGGSGESSNGSGSGGNGGESIGSTSGGGESNGGSGGGGESNSSSGGGSGSQDGTGDSSSGAGVSSSGTTASGGNSGGSASGGEGSAGGNGAESNASNSSGLGGLPSDDSRDPSSSSRQVPGNAAGQSVPGNASSAVASATAGDVNNGTSGRLFGDGTIVNGTTILEPVENVYGGAVVTSATITTDSTAVTGLISNSSPAPAGTGTVTSPSWNSGSSSRASRPDSTGGASTPGSTTTPTSHRGMPKGAIAAFITLGVILFLLFIFFLFRKRLISRRKNKRKKWLFGGSRNMYGSTAISSSRYFAEHPDSGTASVRSSFATTFDRGGLVSPISPQHVPLPPVISVSLPLSSTGRQMEQVWPSNLSGSINAPPLASTVDTDPLPTIRSPDRAHRLSSGSGHTISEEDSASGSSEWLIVPDSAAINERSPTIPSPMSVRPFSPSEAWTFPKPPTDDPRRSRVSTLMVTPESKRTSSNISSEYTTAPENPFSDFASVEDGHTVESILSADTETASHFARVETIRRPFIPTMDDEMATTPGERVRMLQRFDDGWAFAEKVSTGQRGLIPIDCLRMAEQDLPAFLAAKRLSSYNMRPLSRYWGENGEIEQATPGHAI